MLGLRVSRSARRLYVSNTGAGGSNYTGFPLNWNGQLDPIPGSTVTLPIGPGPSEIVLNGNNTRLAGMRVTTSQIDSFILDRRGRLHAAPGTAIGRPGVRSLQQPI